MAQGMASNGIPQHLLVSAPTKPLVDGNALSSKPVFAGLQFAQNTALTPSRRQDEWEDDTSSSYRYLFGLAIGAALIRRTVTRRSVALNSSSKAFVSPVRPGRSRIGRVARAVADATAVTAAPPWAKSHGDGEAWEPNGFWSILTFAWVRGLFDKRHRKVSISDVYPPPAGLRSADLAAGLEAAISARPRASGSEKDTELPLFRIVWKLYAGAFLRSGVLRFLNSAVQFAPALCLSALLGAMEQGELQVGLKAAGYLFAVLTAKGFIENQYFYRITNVAISMRAMLQATIYRKSLRLPESAAAVPPVTLMQVDTGKVENLAYSFHTLWDGIFQFCGYSALLIHYVGYAGLSGLVLLFAMLPVNAWLTRRLTGFNREVLRTNEARVTQTSEVLGGIRATRQMGWEDVFERGICELRDEELRAQRKRSYISAYLISYFSALPPLMIALVLAIYIQTAGMAGFVPSTVFTALSILNQIRFPLLFYPSALEALSEGRTALKRIAAYLTAAEVDVPQEPSLDALSASAFQTPLKMPAGTYKIGGQTSPTLVLKDDMEVKRGELVGIVGAVGTGKTSLVQALLGEIPNIGLPLPAEGVAYCAQRPWISNGLLRDIVCGTGETDHVAFNEACDVAAVDFVSADDEISTGTLSGGQQARIALARTVYHARRSGPHRQELVVLDDSAAALDPQVAATVMEKCVMGKLQGCTRLVVTSATGTLLPRCDRVVVMQREGDDLLVQAVGTYAELIENGLLAPSKHGSGAGHSVKSTVETEVSHDESGDVATDVATAAPVRVTVAEEQAVGAVPASLYRRYLTSVRNPSLLILAMTAVVATYIATVGQQYFIGVWTADRVGLRPLAFYLGGVVMLGLVSSAFTFARTLAIASFARRASRSIHQDLCHSVVVRASTRYFDINPLGRILQRFAKDLEQVDNELPGSMRAAITCGCALGGSVCTIAVANPQFIFALAPLSWLYAKALQYYRPVARELKRLESMSRSPVYAEQAAAAEGVATIRQMRLGNEIMTRALKAIDGNTAVTFAMKAVDRWFSLRMELLGNVLVMATAIVGLFAAESLASSPWAAAKAAVALTQALSVVGLLNWTVRTVADTEKSFSSYQRVLYTTDEAESEAPRHLPSDEDLPANWPQIGRIEFKNVSLRYRDDLPLVLAGVDLTIKPGQRVGVVGRTGSGKSTLLRVLLRIVEMAPDQGSIEIDGVNIQGLGLEKLRSSVTVIPQENLLLTGSVRSNVDPSATHSDEDVVAALQAASLDWPLDRHLSAGGGSISPGERQLLGVARALLRRSRIVALDEVTSRVDEATDRKVQIALRQLPAGTTLLVVSHRLSTLEDYDVAVVMEQGRVAETGSPVELGKSPDSRFGRLLAAERAGGVEQNVPLTVV